MGYHITKIVDAGFEEVRESIIENLSDVGFGVITEIKLDEKIEAKLGVKFRKYLILGACNPGFAYEALQIEEELGVLLPCNVVLIEREDGKVQVSAIDAIKMMSVVGRPELDAVAGQVQERLKQALQNL
jgi:uncharacterized protein (DUF302 family)